MLLNEPNRIFSHMVDGNGSKNSFQRCMNDPDKIPSLSQHPPQSLSKFDLNKKLVSGLKYLLYFDNFFTGYVKQVYLALARVPVDLNNDFSI